MPANRAPRNFCMTVCNPDEPVVIAAVKQLPLRYCVLARETGAGGLRHFQCYVELKSQITWNRLKEILPGAHIEDRRGSAEQAIQYCKKGDQPKEEWDQYRTLGDNYGNNVDIALECGDPAKPGTRTDLENMCNMVQKGKRLSEIAAEDPVTFVKFSKGITNYHALMDEPRQLGAKVEVIVHYGPTGTGKTYKAMHDNPGCYKYSLTNGQWYDGYEGHEVVVFDEFRGQITFGTLLQLLDVYQMKVPVKGTFREWKPTKIIITSPVHPGLWYPGLASNDGKISQLKRRIASIYYFKEGQADPTNPVVEDHTDRDWPSAKDTPEEGATSGAWTPRPLPQFMP